MRGPSAPFLIRLAVGVSMAGVAAPAPAQIPPPPPAATPTPTPIVLKTLVGEVVQVDATRGLIVVGESVKASHVKPGGKRQKPVTLTVDRTTKLTRGSRPASFADVKAGDHAVVKYLASASGSRAVSVRLADVAVRAADAGSPAPGTTAPSPD